MRVLSFVLLISFLISFKLFAINNTKPEKIIIGNYKSRAIFSKSYSANKLNAPTVILIPGSGANGPEEAMPGSLTTTGKTEPLFNQLASALNKAGFNTLQLGKPGVDFHNDSFDFEKIFYDYELFKKSTWKDYLDNVDFSYQYLLQRGDIDPAKIYLLGHSEGTKVSIDYVKYRNSEIKGLILLGYSGEDMETVIDWQVFEREIEYFVMTDVDDNRDNIVTKEEASKWKEFQLDWDNYPSNHVSISEIRRILKNDPKKNAFSKKSKESLIWKDIVREGPNYSRAASLSQPIFVFTGELDLQTRAVEAENLGKECALHNKLNCYINIVPGLGHGFSPPKGERKHPLLDISIGPIEESFLDFFENYLENVVLGE